MLDIDALPECYGYDGPLMHQYDTALAQKNIDPTDASFRLYPHLDVQWSRCVSKADVFDSLTLDQQAALTGEENLPAPPDALKHVPPLDELDVEITDVRWLADISTNYRRNAVFKIEWQGGIYALKVYHEDPPEEELLDGEERFRAAQERRAYANFKAAGICELGHGPVLYPYGALLLPGPGDSMWWKKKRDIQISETDSANPFKTWLKAFAKARGPLDALLLEWLDAPPRLDRTTLTVAQGRAVLHAMKAVHYARVAHRDVGYRKILVSPSSGRAVIVDFEEATVWPDASCELRRGLLRSDMDQAIVAFYKRDHTPYYDSDEDHDDENEVDVEGVDADEDEK